jgi:hypothetical protein
MEMHFIPLQAAELDVRLFLLNKCAYTVTTIGIKLVL